MAQLGRIEDPVVVVSTAGGVSVYHRPDPDSEEPWPACNCRNAHRAMLKDRAMLPTSDPCQQEECFGDGGESA